MPAQRNMGSPFGLAMLCLFAVASVSQGLEPKNMRTWRIVMAGDATASERYAAEEFQTYFEKIAGIKLPIQTSTEASDENVFIGASPALRSSPLAYVLERDYQPEELRFVVRPDNIAIVGGRPRGVLYGVYQLLEDVLGVRFLTDDHTYVPAASTAAPADATLDYSYRPPLSFRLALYSEVIHHPHFAARLRANGRTGNWKLDEHAVEQVGGHSKGGVILHSISGWLDMPFETHPEYYALWQGKRHPAQPCPTHPDVRRIITKNVISRTGFWPPNHVIPIAYQDTNIHCQCDTCRAFMQEHGGAASGPLLDLVNEVARSVAPVRADAKVGTLAYGPTRVPPTGMRAEPNVRIQYATYHACQRHGFGLASCPPGLDVARQMHAWNEIADDLVYWHYLVNFRDFLLPPVNLEAIGPQIRAMAASNGTGIFLQGPGGGKNLPFSDLMIYCVCRLAWNPALNEAALTQEFLDLHYGRAAGPIREFLARVQSATRDAPAHENCNGKMDQYGLTPELGREGIRLFEQARKHADSPVVRDRVEKASICAYRLALGHVWYDEAPTDLTPQRRREYQEVARKLYALCQKHGVNEHGEGWPLERSKANVRKALGLDQDAPL